MKSDYVDVYLGNEVVASKVIFDIALILVRGLFEKYYDDNTLEITIKKPEAVCA